jgi:hypothetical protein
MRRGPTKYLAAGLLTPPRLPKVDFVRLGLSWTLKTCDDEGLNRTNSCRGKAEKEA